MNRLRALAARLREDDGVSLVELGVAMVVTAMMAALMISWIFSIAAADDLHLADDQAIQDLRIAKDEITRELRRTTEVVAIGPDAFTIWIDDDHDEVKLTTELVTWEIDSEGDLVRSLGDGTSSVRLQRVSAAESGFTFDASLPEVVTSIGMILTVLVDAPRGDDGVRSLSTEISLRGVS